MRADRFGSYSIVATLPGTPNLFRLKSMIRYSRRVPPPRCRVVTWPCTFRPLCFLSTSVSGLYGSFVVISSNVETVMPRRPGDVGLYFLIAIDAYPPGLGLDTLEELDRVPGFERDDRL